MKGLDPRLSTTWPVKTNGRFLDLGFDGRQAPYDASLPPDFFLAENGEGDGIFQPGEPLDERGSRLILHPRLGRSFQVANVLEVSPEIGWMQTLYRSNEHEFAERGLLTARTDVRTRLIKDYARSSGSVVRHVLEPQLSWALVSQRHQRGNPLFVPRDGEQIRLRTLSLENVTRDPSDRTPSANKVVLGLNQRFFSADRTNSTPHIRGDLLTAVDWDFSNGEGLGNLVAEGRMFPIGPIGGRVRAVFDPEAVAFEEGGVELSLALASETRFIRRASLVGGYRYVGRPPLFFESDDYNSNNFENGGESALNQVDFQIQTELAWRIRLTYAAIYGLEGDASGFIRNRGMVEYVSKCRCWGFGVQLDYENRGDFQGGFTIRFLGLGDDRGNLFDSGVATGINL